MIEVPAFGCTVHGRAYLRGRLLLPMLRPSFRICAPELTVVVGALYGIDPTCGHPCSVGSLHIQKTPRLNKYQHHNIPQKPPY